MIIGLTGSIGMGKSTTAGMFAEEGIPIWDADATVAGLYSEGGAAVEAVAGIVPDAVNEGAVNRQVLRDAISADPSVLDKLNAVVHPLVAQSRMKFLERHKDEVVLLDVPLLFETGSSELCDFIVVVSVPADVQRERVLGRGEMSEEDFELILSRQMPDEEKRSKADRVIPTLSLDETRQAVRDLVAELRQRQSNA